MELQLSYGHLSYDLLSYYFKKGEKYYYDFCGTKVGCAVYLQAYDAIDVG